jgi:hypothetical protein
VTVAPGHVPGPFPFLFWFAEVSDIRSHHGQL